MNKKLTIITIILLVLLPAIYAIFTEDTTVSSQITGLQYSSQAWGDYNNDGNPDLITCGADTGNTILTKLYLLNNSQLTEDTTQDVINVTECSVNLADIDKDGYLDLIVSGRNASGTSNFTTAVYKNNGTNFNKLQTLVGLKFSNTILADIDNDGDLDLALAGCSGGGIPVETNCTSMNSSIYLNNGSHLIHNQTWSENLTNLWKVSLAFGDYDNDGDLDLALAGTTSTATEDQYEGGITKLYLNNGTTFNEDTTNTLEGTYWGSLAWADFNNDTALDLFLSGRNTSGNRITKIFRSDANENSPNTRPSFPTTSSNYENGILNISWTQGSDTETPTNGVYYNLRAGENETTNDIVSSYYARSSNPTQGYFGNMGQMLYKLINIEDRCVFYQVQTIDTGMMASGWSTLKNHSSNETCDNYDNDCDNIYNNSIYASRVDEGFDKDNDSFWPYSGTLNGTDYNCTGRGNGSLAYDCDDSNPNVYPGSSCTRTGYSGATYEWDHATLSCICTGGTSISGTGGGSTTYQGITENSDTDDTTSTETTEKETKTSGGETTAYQPEYEELIKKIIDNRVKHTRTAYSRDGRTQIIEKIKNIDLFEQEVKATINIPKNIIESTDDIIQITEFNIIQRDPIIQFNLGSISPSKEKIIEYSIKKELTEEEIKQIQLSIELEDTKEKEREDLFRKTQDIIKITTEAKVDEKKQETEFTLNIDFKNDSILYDAKIYTEIPKCLVEIIEEIMIEADIEFDIVSKDPLIVWHFKKLTKGDKLKYIIKSIADEDCLNQAKTYAIAKQIVLLEADLPAPEDKYSKILFPSLYLLLLITALFYLSGFTGKRKRTTLDNEHLIKHTITKYPEAFNTKNIEDKLILDGFAPKKIEAAITYSKKPKILRFLRKHLFGGELFFLAILILLNILDFFKLLPGDLDFIKKIVSWTLLTYLLYEISIIKSLFGETKKSTRKLLDVLLLLFYFSLIFKLLIEFAKTSFQETNIFKYILLGLAKYAVEAQNISLYIGFIGLLLVSLLITLFVEIKKPSFFYVFTSLIGRRSIEKKKIFKFIAIYLILMAFYITLYNFVFEWLAIAIDASLLMVAIILTLLIFIKRGYYRFIHHRTKNIRALIRLRITAGIENIVNYVDSFDFKFFHLLPYRKFTYLVIIGILILHLITEAGIFIIPYTTGATDPTYFSELGEGHTPILNLVGYIQKYLHKTETRSLLKMQIAGLELKNTLMLLAIYLMNILAAFFLFVNPLLIWLHMYRNRNKPAHEVSQLKSRAYGLFQFIFVTSIPALLLTPIFIITYASNKTGLGSEFESVVRGIDIKTQLIQNISLVPYVLLISAGLAVLYLILSRKLERYTTTAINATNIILITGYLALFYIDIHQFYIGALKDLLKTNIFFFVNFLLFFIITSLFYLIGISLLIIELIVRGEIYFPKPFIKLVGKIYAPLWNHIIPHHHLPHLVFYDHYIELEHGEKHKHLHAHVKSTIKNIHNNPDILEKIVKKQVKKGHHELFFIEEYLLEHNWPAEVIEKVIRKVKRDPTIDKELKRIMKKHHEHKTIHKLSQKMQIWYDKRTHSLLQIFNHFKKRGWTEEDIREALSEVKVKGLEKKTKNLLLRTR